MKSLNLLKLEAIVSAEHYRSHSMGPWEAGEWNEDTTSYCTCEWCGAHLAVDSKPQPNGIDISGDSVAINCPCA